MSMLSSGRRFLLYLLRVLPILPILPWGNTVYARLDYQLEKYEWDVTCGIHGIGRTRTRPDGTGTGTVGVTARRCRSRIFHGRAGQQDWELILLGFRNFASLFGARVQYELIEAEKPILDRFGSPERGKETRTREKG
jgi:hypothetical protein